MEQIEQEEPKKSKRGNPRIAEYSLAAGTRWKKGQSGNPKGRTPAKLITDALKGIYDNPENLKKFVLAAHRRALKGNPKFWEMIADRLEGKVLQQIEHVGEITHLMSEIEKKQAESSIQKIRALESNSETPLIARWMCPECGHDPCTCEEK